MVSGLEAGDRVASGATFFIDSESQLRAAMEGYALARRRRQRAARAAGRRRHRRFATEPDPPRNGDNTFVVTLKGRQGAPVTDAEVTVRLYMAPMPSMNMPAMRAETRLLHAGQGVYRGRGRVSMAGRWDVTVAATRAGARLANRPFAIVAQ